ncbi:MAG: hypothetical protein V3U92_17445 [Cellulophaga sp.]
MKKSILNLGKALNRLEQKAINGGGPYRCNPQGDSYCCGPANWQCGYCGMSCGGIVDPGGLCNCF